jgi:hypothetical protein
VAEMTEPQTEGNLVDLLNLTPAERKTLLPEQRESITRIKSTRTQSKTMAAMFKVAVRGTDPDTKEGRRAREAQANWDQAMADFEVYVAATLEQIAADHAARMAELTQ